MIDAISSCVRFSSESCLLADSRASCGCVQVWLPICMPAVIQRLDGVGVLRACDPITKNVATACSRSSSSSTSSVCGPGPSSNVSATWPPSLPFSRSTVFPWTTRNGPCALRDASAARRSARGGIAASSCRRACRHGGRGRAPCSCCAAAEDDPPPRSPERSRLRAPAPGCTSAAIRRRAYTLMDVSAPAGARRGRRD